MINAATSRTNAPRQGTPWAVKMTQAEMTPLIIIAAPDKAPKLILYPSIGSFNIEAMVALTSAAPFPKARRVTPANRGGKPNFMANISRAGLK